MKNDRNQGVERPSLGGVLWALAALLFCASAPSQAYDLSQDFSTAANPNGAWSYGAKTSITGALSVLTFHQTQPLQAGLAQEAWLWANSVQPIIARFTGTTTWTIPGGVFPPGTVTCDAGTDGSAQKFAVIRFTLPSGASGTYQLQTSVHSKYDGGSSRDSDFHIVQNGVEIYGLFMPPNSGTGYTNTLSLVAGDTIDFAVGRGADGLESGSGLKIQATLSLANTNPVAPVIVTQPQTQTAFVGANVTFAVAASGIPSPSYLWFFGSNAVAGATNSVLVLSHVQFEQAGAYSVVVSNASGAVTSDNAILTVIPAPGCVPSPDGLVAWWGFDGDANDLNGPNAFAFSGPLQFAAGEVDQAVVLNSSTYGHAAASSALNAGVSSGLSVEAWINPTDASGLQNLVEWNDHAGNIGAHFAISVPNSYGGGPGCLFANLVDTGGVSHQVTSDPGLLASGVFQHVALTYDKASGLASLYLNGAQVGLTNLGTFTPQTSFDLYLGVRPSGPISGIWFSGLVDELSIYNRALPQAAIQALVSAGIGGKCKVARAPVILAQPADVASYAGGQASFHVTAGGTGPLNYFWFFGSNAIPAATSSTLVLANVQADQAGPYSVVISNAVGSVTSAVAMLTINAVPGCAPAPDGLVAWWGLDGSGDDLAGGSPLGFSGAGQFGQGEVGQALLLGGASRFARASASSSLNVGLSSGISIEAWINPSDASRLADLVEWNNAVGSIGAHFAISVPNSYGGGPGCLFANLVDTAGVSHQVTSVPGLLTSGVFQHVALTYDKSSGLAALYLNGSQVALTNLGTFTPQTSYNLYVGTRPSGPVSGQSFVGAIDELSIYNRALSKPEIQAVFTAMISGKCKVARAPTILVQPQDVSSYVGGAAVFHVTAGGTPPLSYIWFFNSDAVPTATNSAFVLNNVQQTQAGPYSVVVANSAGSVTSVTAVLTINPIPSCAPEPDGLVALWSLDGTGDDEVGGNAFTFFGGASYAAAEVGQGIAIDGAHGYGKAAASPKLDVGVGVGLTIETWVNPANPAQLADLVEWNKGQGDIGAHFAISVPTAFGGGAGSIYANLVDSWGVSHQIASEPGLLAAHVFQHLALTYDKASGVASLYLNGAQVAVTNLGSFSPQTSYDLYLGTRPSGPVSGQWFAGILDELSLYSRALSPSEIAAISAAALGGKCKTARPPVIVTSPQDLSQVVGATAIFTVGVSGSRPLSYQWQFNQIPLDAGTNASLVLQNIQTNQAGGYSVVVSNLVGAATSGVATLTVRLPEQVPPVITLQPVGTSAPVGSNVFLSVAATGAVPILYQWFWNGSVVLDATNSSFVLIAAQFNQAGAYFVTISNPYGSVTSRVVTVSIDDYEGGAVLFANTFGYVHPYVFDVDGVTRLQGPAYLVQLYAGTNEATLMPIGGATPFLTGSSAGLFFGGSRYISAVPPGGLATVQVRAWDVQSGPTFEQAFSAGGRVGLSHPFVVHTAGGSPPQPPTWLLGLQSFSLQTNGVTLAMTNGSAGQSNPPVLLDPQMMIGGLPATLSGSFSSAGASPKGGPPPNTQFHFTIWAEVGKTYVIESSTDLRVWQPFTNVFNISGPFQISDPASAANPRRFYRVRTQP